MAETKPMKPARAWAVICDDGKLSTVENVACLFPTRKDAERWTIKTERPIRVRIIEDRDVERVIAAMRRVLDVTVEGSADIIEAIRDLGGRP